MTENERQLLLDKILAIKRQIEEVRNLNNIPAIDQALRMADLYCFLSTQHLGYVGALFPAEEAWA